MFTTHLLVGLFRPHSFSYLAKMLDLYPGLTAVFVRVHKCLLFLRAF